MRLSLIIVNLFILSLSSVFSQEELLPLFSIGDMEYIGGFRVPANDYGVSDINYSEGPITYNSDNHSIFIVGHAHDQAVAEFAIPELVNSTELSELNMAEAPLQNFSTILDRSSTGNFDNINRIGGLEFINGSLFVNGYEYYDADGSATVSTLVVEDAANLAASAVRGFYAFDASAGSTSGWISPIPEEWKSSLSGDYIVGQSSGIPIISRTSVGPTAYSFNAGDFYAPENVATSQLLDFSYPNGLHDDLDNSEGQNNIWTHLSRVTYGFIIPGTRTYFTIGHSGGLESGVCYKCTQDDGNVCGGYCTPLVEDNYQYYWLWDMGDMMEVMAGERAANSVQPYDHGIFNTPIQANYKNIGGGTFDMANKTLYLSIQRADNEQGTYARPPLIVAFKIHSSQILPVNLLDFFGRVQKETIHLEWEVEDNENIGSFVIEKRSKNVFVELGRVVASGQSKYAFSDRTPSELSNEYRLKMFDLNGEYTYSKVITVRYSIRDIIKVFPNPTKGGVLLVHGLKENQYFELFTLGGKSVLKSHQSETNVSRLQPSIYFLRIADTTYKVIIE